VGLGSHRSTLFDRSIIESAAAPPRRGYPGDIPVEKEIGWPILRGDGLTAPDHRSLTAPIAVEALRRIGDLYEVERTITGAPPKQRCSERRKRSKPITELLRA
jgi:hypothetical protein